MNDFIYNVAVWAIPVVLAITLHEAAHGYVARMFGDPTAHMMGRITLNPLKHIDPVGTLLVPGGIVLMNAITGASFPPFGWAKPVPVDFGRLRKPKADMLWVAAAGPASNFVQAIVWALLVGFLVRMQGSPDSFWFDLAQRGMLVNVGLMLINLVPVPPLDGGRIVVSLLPLRQALAWSRLEPYGFFILIGLLYFGILDYVLRYVAQPILSFLMFFTGL
ncbi:MULTISPECIES: site-2 protease family protein [Uliginosibacterium]|uniref:Site-2 protease family protein n=1 Tax=Uliginosibacterium aquaticum TaxID=2731212 RepID=A0ABX2IF37_9RHOO|nr:MULTISPECIES: site-2 protease family protein [Uliginosibacterium]MDO6385048.1 site-2 protease family protein [Uliginosibacterium sp. 31-12]NSL55248.1 site-2 protease family protein [Uliginosibacterium aquaticum]